MSSSRIYKPKAVTMPANVLMVTIVVGAVMMALEYLHFKSGALDGFPPVYEGIVYGALIVLSLLISTGQGWARFLLAAYFLAMLVLGVPMIIGALAQNPVLQVLAVIQLLLLGVSLVMLFGSRANAWYKG